MDAEIATLLVAVAGAGLLAGFLAGLLGVGGGLVFVPALLAILRAQGVPGELAMHAAVGSSLAAIVLSSASSVRSHARRGNVEWAVWRRLLPGLVLGALLGAALAAALSGDALRRVFGVFLFVVAIQMAGFFRTSPHRALPGAAGLAAAGTGVGVVAAVVGIGGGVLTAPFLVWCNRPMLNAVGTAAAAGIPIAVAGAVGFAVAGAGAVGLPAGSTGFVVWPAALTLGGIAMLAAPLGVRAAHRVPALALRRVFAVALVAVGLRLLVG